MKKLSYKIFAANFLTVVSVVILVLCLRYFSNRHFLDYVNQVEFERHTALVEQLKQDYQISHSWNYLKSDRRAWMDTIMTAMRNSNVGQDPLFERNRMTGPGQGSDSEIGRYRRPPFMEIRGPRQRLFLFDANKNLVAGHLPPSDTYILREISYDGKIIGWLGLRKREQMETPPEIAFIRQQHGLLYIMGGGILLISLIVSFLLARHFLTPIKKLKEGTQAISSRQFGARIVVQS